MRQGTFSFDSSDEVAILPAFEYKECGVTKPVEKMPQFSMRSNDKCLDIVDFSREPKSVKEPFSENISAGKNTYVYDAHTYHTKVPPAGIKKLIEYYTNAGDVVLDPFCGSGMTGVATLELGRKAVLSDLSPAATFIAYNFCTPVSSEKFHSAVKDILARSRALELYLYGTRSRENGKLVPSLYMVWSFGYLCSCCGKEFVLWDVARDERDNIRESKILSEFSCPHCATLVSKRKLQRTKRYPVQIGYSSLYNRLKEATATPSTADLDRLSDIEARGIPQDLWYPKTEFTDGVNTRQPMAAGILSVDQAYTKRGLWSMAHLWQLAHEWPDEDIRDKLLFTITSLYKRVTVFSEFRFWGGSGNTANFNVPAIMNEQNVFRAFERKAKTIGLYFADAPKMNRELRVSCQSATKLAAIPSNSIDYVFTDPPFGGNINYSEMNILWESWLGVFTDTDQEAIINRHQGKGAAEYSDLLRKSFQEIGRVVKPGGWVTIVFHNSSAAVWSALQDAIVGAQLEIKGTQTFDKKHGTFKQFVSENAVGYDLVLHCQPIKEGEQSNINVDDVGVVRFIRDKLQKEEEYSVSYLHVRRKREFDYRRLYAEWLTKSISLERITLSFESFRSLVDQVRISR